MSAFFDYFAQHQDYVFYILSGLCLLLEFSFLNLSGPLLFIAIGGLITAVLMSIGLITDFSIALVMLAGFSGASAGLLWPLLNEIQNPEEVEPETSEMVGKILPVCERITQTEGCVFYSGIEWLARLDANNSEPIEVNNQVEVIGIEDSIMVVRLI